MSDTAIEWTDRVWNPTTGCDRISPGCLNCYALTMAKRLKGMGSAKYQRDGDPRTSGPGFGVSVHPDTLDAPLKWLKPQRIFVNSMSDLFHDEVPADFIAKVFAIMSIAPHHTFQVLTKRHARMRALLNSEDFQAEVIGHALWFADHWRGWPDGRRVDPAWPRPNIWLGVSAENQQWADIRIPALLDTPAAIRFVSAEPLLGPIDLRRHMQCFHCKTTHRFTHLSGGCDKSGRPIPYGPLAKRHIDWVIVGGESGHGARPMHPRWAETIHQQCEAAGVAYLFKQWGEWTPMAPMRDGKFDFRGSHAMTDDGNLYEPGALTYPDGPRVSDAYLADFPHHHPTSMYRVGKHRAGRELYHDGRTFDGYPESVTA